MKYALLIYSKYANGSFDELSEEEKQSLFEQYREVELSPSVIATQQLQPSPTATVVRVENGETLLSDGPYIEAKEHLGGFFLVEADNLDQATAIAARLPATWMGGAVEVRPVVER